MKKIKVYVYEDDRGMIFQSRKKHDVPHFKLIGESEVNVIHEPEEKPVRREFFIINDFQTTRPSVYDYKPNNLDTIHVSEIHSGEKILSRDDVEHALGMWIKDEEVLNELFGDSSQ